MAKKSTIEVKFASSVLLFIAALALIFMIMRIYQPLESSHIAASNREKPSIVARQESRNYMAATKSNPIHQWPSEALSDDRMQNKNRRLNSKAKPPTEVVSMGPNQVEDLLTSAMRKVDDGDPQSAQTILERVLKADPHNELALVELGMIYLIDFKDSAKAQGYLEKALQVNPNNRVVLSELVGVYNEADQAQAGTSFLRGLYEENPENSYLALGLGQILLGQDKVNEALPYLERASADDNNPGAITEYADALSEAGQGDKALDSYSRALDIAMQRNQNGYYDDQPGVADERIAIARVDLIGELLAQRDPRAPEQIEHLRKEISDDQAAALFEQLIQRKGSLKR